MKAVLAALESAYPAPDRDDTWEGAVYVGRLRALAGATVHHWADPAGFTKDISVRAGRLLLETTPLLSGSRERELSVTDGADAIGRISADALAAWIRQKLQAFDSEVVDTSEPWMVGPRVKAYYELVRLYDGYADNPSWVVNLRIGRASTPVGRIDCMSQDMQFESGVCDECTQLGDERVKSVSWRFGDYFNVRVDEGSDLARIEFAPSPGARGSMLLPRKIASSLLSDIQLTIVAGAEARRRFA